MLDFTFRQLRYVLALADHAHFGKAANAVHVTQPALSQQIKLLEAQLGAALFERQGRSVRPTPLGEEFILRARAILSEAAALQSFAASHRGTPTRPLRFGLIPTVAPYLLPELYPALQTRMPDIQFTISESRTDRLLEDLGSGNLDLGLIATEVPPHQGLIATELFADPFVLATSANSNLPDPVSLASLPKDAILLLDEGHCFRDQAITACAMSDPDTKRTFAATSLATIVEFVANGQGVTLLPTISLKKEANDPRIRISGLSAPGAGRMLSLVWRQSTPFDRLFKNIAGLVRDIGEKRLTEPV
jgi:LysR family hydrogen peroxide-inducible transcriptional activator